LYGYRVVGQDEPRQALRGDPTKLLLDPYGRAVAVPGGYSRKAAVVPGDNLDAAMKSVVADLRGYDWEGDAPCIGRLCRRSSMSCMWTASPATPRPGTAERRGSYAG